MDGRQRRPQTLGLQKSDGTRDDGDNGKDIGLHADNADPQGIWSDGTTMWVGDSTDTKLYAYKLSLEVGETDHRDSNKDVSLAGRASGISDPTGM